MALSRQYVEKCQNWLQWYNYNLRAARTAGVEQQLKFALKANHGAMELIAALTDELQRISNKELQNPAERLILPVGVRW